MKLITITEFKKRVATEFTKTFVGACRGPPDTESSSVRQCRQVEDGDAKPYADPGVASSPLREEGDVGDAGDRVSRGDTPEELGDSVT
mmetsp:Transcript_57227/g.133841  ORF Transcript_57227/g.133841 Transcript_57227/m.133841 type:complete len:88 (-) Transcript_57227:1281-1544(-)